MADATLVPEHAAGLILLTGAPGSRLARLVQLGISQSRYFGRVKTKFQWYPATTVANLTLVAGEPPGQSRYKLVDWAKHTSPVMGRAYGGVMRNGKGASIYGLFREVGRPQD